MFRKVTGREHRQRHVSAIASMLRKNGFQVHLMRHWDERRDGIIHVEPGLCVQVGLYYLRVYRWHGSNVELRPVRKSLRQAIEDLKSFPSQEKSREIQPRQLPLFP